MKMIACVSPRTSGVLSVLGRDPDLQPAEIKQRLGVVPQETNLDPDFNLLREPLYLFRLL